MKTFAEILKESTDKTIVVGDKIKWNDREWTVTKIKGARYYLKTEGFPEQSVDYLKLNGWIDSGKAKIVKK